MGLRWKLDGTVVVIWLVGVGVVAVSSYLAARQERLFARRMFWSSNSARGTAAGRRDEPGESRGGFLEGQEQQITWKQAVGLLFMSAGMLIGLYFLVKAGFGALITLMQVWFGYVGFLATSQISFIPCLSRSRRLRSRRCVVPLIGRVTLADCLAWTLSTALLVTWGVCRHASWSWVLLNFIGTHVCILIVSVLRLGSIKVATVLLVLFFFYDIFMVFITPSIFGDSVMVEVATGGGANRPSAVVHNTSTGGGRGGGDMHVSTCVRTPGENMPMLFMIPRLQGWPAGYSMLGYGDIIFPSLLLALVMRFDYFVRGTPCTCLRRLWRNESGRIEAMRPGHAYFVVLLVGYGVGLALAFLFNMLGITINGVQGQPALLYLVPCTLGPLLVMSWCQGEFRELWDGPNFSGDEEYASDGGSDADADADADEDMGEAERGSGGGRQLGDTLPSSAGGGGGLAESPGNTPNMLLQQHEREEVLAVATPLLDRPSSS